MSPVPSLPLTLRCGNVLVYTHDAIISVIPFRPDGFYVIFRINYVHRTTIARQLMRLADYKITLEYCEHYHTAFSTRHPDQASNADFTYDQSESIRCSVVIQLIQRSNLNTRTKSRSDKN